MGSNGNQPVVPKYVDHSSNGTIRLVQCPISSRSACSMRFRMDPKPHQNAELGQRLNPFAKPDKVPSIFRLLFHVMFLPSYHHQMRIRQLSELPFVRFVRPDITIATIAKQTCLRRWVVIALCESSNSQGDVWSVPLRQSGLSARRYRRSNKGTLSAGFSAPV